MAKGVIGKPFTFTALFLDAVGDPVDPISPTIDVWYYDSAGDRVDIIPAGTALPGQVPALTGRYAFTVTVPGGLDPSFQVYGLMRGEDPGSGDNLVVEQEVDLFAEENPGGAGASTGGLRFSFTKAGKC